MATGHMPPSLDLSICVGYFRGSEGPGRSSVVLNKCCLLGGDGAHRSPNFLPKVKREGAFFTNDAVDGPYPYSVVGGRDVIQRGLCSCETLYI